MALQKGENVGPYRVIGQLGQGGMASVYKAYHPQLDRHVAIKMMHQAFLEDETFLARFQREAQIVARLEHPHIVPVYDFNEHNGQPYLVMKFIEGRTLKYYLSKGPLSLKQILHIMTAVGGALTYAHQKGVLHRDIKPSNIVIDAENTPYLTDFGLARIAQAGESTISTDMVLGTPHYISPEQARGQKNLDGRTDIYSLGVVLYELVVGRVPFSADTPYAIIHDHIYTPLPLPTVVNPEIPASIELVLLKALAKDPTDRFETPAAMVATFREAVEQEGMQRLNPNRASVAAISLAKQREQQERISTPTPVPVGVPAPLFSYTVGADTSSIAQQQPTSQTGKKWILGGLLAFFLICLLGAAITLGASDKIGDLIELRQASTDAPGYALYSVPQLTLADAQVAVNNQPEDAGAYLTLARALWRENQPEEARQAIQTGAPYAENEVIYLLTAAKIAQAAGETNDAATYYIVAFNQSQNEDTYPVARAMAGEYLYNLAGNPNDLNLTEVVRNLAAEQGIRNLNLDSPLVRLTTARALITGGQLRRANLILSDLTTQNNMLAEVNLVLGELYQAQGNTPQAVSAWETAARSSPLPEWVRQRAEELIKSVEE